MPTNGITGVVVASLPVTDLATSAAWYRDLLGLDYLREFESGGVIGGCALGHPDTGYVLALRLRAATAGQPDLRGEHPLIFGVADPASLDRVHAHAAALGYRPTRGQHRDAAWVEVVDPDGIATRFAYPTRRWTRFIGIHFDGDGSDSEYDAPQLTLPAPGVSHGRSGTPSGMDAPELIDREVVYRGKMITVHRDTIRQPDGSTAEREVVDHPDSVAVVALDPQGRVLLVYQYRHPVGAYLWELPAGLLDRPGEPALDAAQRELAEETGTAARRWHTLVDMYTSPGMTGERVRVFLARDLHPAGGGHGPDPDEGILTTDRVPLDEAVRRVRAGDIANGLAVAGLLAAAQSRPDDFADLDH